MNETLLLPYQYVAYVDASGDDGIKFGKGSSSCYAVATFIVKKEDIPFNEDLLLEIKKSAGLKPTDELKYTTLRKKRNFSQILNLLTRAKGQLITWIAFKEAITDTSLIDPKKKLLSSMCHYFPIRSIKNLSIDNILIAVDVMKKVEMDTLSALINHGLISDCSEANITYDLKFYDSKNKDFTLIQLADVFSGILRSTADDLYLHKKFMFTCANCFRMQGVRHSTRTTKCPVKKDFFPLTRNLHAIKNLLVKNLNDDRLVCSSITCFPVNYLYCLQFLDCPLFK